MIIWCPELPQASLSSKSPWATGKHHLSFSSGWVYFTSHPLLDQSSRILKALLLSVIVIVLLCPKVALHLWLTENCAGPLECVKSTPADAGKQIHSHIYEAILRHGPESGENWRSQGTQTNRERWCDGSVRQLVNLYSQLDSAVSDISDLWLFFYSIGSHQLQEFCHFLLTTSQSECGRLGGVKYQTCWSQLTAVWFFLCVFECTDFIVSFVLLFDIYFQAETFGTVLPSGGVVEDCLEACCYFKWAITNLR